MPEKDSRKDNMESFMKRKFLVAGLIASMLVSGFTLTGCGDKCPNGGCTVSNNGSGNTCGKGSCAAASYMSNYGPNSPSNPPGCDC